MNEKITNNKVPTAQNPSDISEQFIVLVDIIKILRKECPWDSKQTNESIAHLMIEEAYETIDAIHSHDDPEFSKELGDLLLHIIMHAIMAEERGAFGLLDVLQKIQKKLVDRHPHVFGDTKVTGEEEVMSNWEALKKKEGKKSALEGVPASMPALLQAERIQHKASRVGFDWDNKEDVWKKVEEEMGELKHEFLTGNSEKAYEEFGDFLFAIVNAARFENIVPEEALHKTNKKFIRRFQYIEQKALALGKILNDMTLAEMDALWDEAKEEEKSKNLL